MDAWRLDMPSIESLIAPGGLIRELALCYPPGHGLGCCVRVRMIMLATVDMVPDDARKGIASLGPWAQLDPKWKEANLDRYDWGPWDALYANWLHEGSTVEIHAPRLTPGRTHVIQAWKPGLRTGGHTWVEILSADGNEIRRVQSGVDLGYRDDPLPASSFPRWPGRPLGILTLPEGI